MKRGFETVINKKNAEETLLPLRGTKTSAGYDFYAVKDIEIKPQEKVMFWTDVKAKMLSTEVLLLDIRSSMGINNDLMMANTIPVIDSDYYNNPKNEGNIGICLRNLKPEMKLKGFSYANFFVRVPIIEDLREDNTVHIKAGERICQGFFVEYKEADNCNTENERTGGIGSTTKEEIK